LAERVANVAAATFAVAIVTGLVGAGAWTKRVDSSSPSIPTNLAVQAATNSTISISWDASHDNVGVAGYTVYRGAVESLGLSQVATTTGSQVTLAGLACGTSYKFAVEAFDAAGNRSKRATSVAATAECVDTQPPTAPSAIRQV